RKKRLFLDWLRVQNQIDTFMVYSSWQKNFIRKRWKLPPACVALLPFMVDTRFFAPDQVRANPQQMICSVGLEFRDYATLKSAVQGMQVRVIIAAASPWSKR